MKIYNYSIFQSLRKVVMVLLSIVLLSACDDFLDVKPTTELDRDELFRSERGYVDALTGVYTQMAAAVELKTDAVSTDEMQIAADNLMIDDDELYAYMSDSY